MSAVLADSGRITVVGLGGTILTSEDGATQFSQRIHPERMALTGVVAGPGNRLLLSGEDGITIDDPGH